MQPIIGSRKVLNAKIMEALAKAKDGDKITAYTSGRRVELTVKIIDHSVSKDPKVEYSTPEKVEQ